MLLADVRRLTGPNLLSSSPLVIVELTLDVPDVFEHCREVYLHELARMRTALGFAPDVATTERPHRGGAVIGYEAPLDVMLACAEMSEWAGLSACEILRDRAQAPLEPKRTEIEEMLAKDRNPALVALEAAAKQHGVPFLWDDSTVSVGIGPTTRAWNHDALPAVADVDWSSLASIPVALVTGTNGKTTTTRLLTRMVREGGRRVGTTSSDGVIVNGDVVEEGDWTGPAAARMVLRRTDIDVAVLETARGGILRRGLALDTCDAAAITNVSEDHTGGYGIDDLHAMTRVKGVVAYAVRKTGTVVLNAHDPKLIALARTLTSHVVLVADLERGDPAAAGAVEAHRALGGEAILAVDGAIVCAKGAMDIHEQLPIAVAEIPVTFGGAARYNVENVLTAVALARSLGVATDAIVRALTGFQIADNPRRGELHELHGVRIMLDFGHNPEGVRAVLRLVATLRGAGRLFVIAGSAGDRTNHEIQEMARAITEAQPHRVLLRELAAYMRGRIPGEVSGIFKHMLEAHGLAPEIVTIAASEVSALEAAMSDARPGDFVLVLIHIEDEAVHAYLETLR